MPHKKLPTKTVHALPKLATRPESKVGKPKRLASAFVQKAKARLPAGTNGAGRGAGAEKAGRTLPDSIRSTIDAIRAFHRERCFAMEQRKRCDLALGSFLRTQLGWRRDLPDDERKEIAKRADDLILQGEAVLRGKQKEIDQSYAEHRGVIEAALQSRRPWDAIESAAVKQLGQLATNLPIWPTFGEPIRGFGPVSLAIIVAEAGDLANYATESKLWKRMGVAVMGDVRQGGLAKGASAEQWIAHGYNRQRRSRLWNIGDALIKGNRDGKYRQCYLKRKEYELAREPEMKPIKAHRRAQRYMEKRLLRDLWRAWRATRPMTSERKSLQALPAENSLVAA